ncbi:4-(cytidine 5'-diphospho)-2-C-methyl-D-erythritol kinase [Tepidimonas sp.]|uniref:4-(cytidine 5'-diphospho)-2-C-methyl-D-erythritol kinase n=1 Tax=Tepidimonas sp. TaxID=2002775 RepID=UPI002FE0A171
MRSLLDVPAPAKLNLFLHVTARRADGYHELQSVFCLIDWADTLHFECRCDGQITREDLHDTDAPLPADDLCVRAARALQAASGCTYGAHIVLDKSIPQQAGLGGGSSDAASTLLALNRLWGLRWPTARLLELAAGLGADVPFFVAGRTAWVEGIGDRVQPIALPTQRWAVVKPPQGTPTAAIFRSPDLKRNTPAVTMSSVVADPANREALARGCWGGNDLQAVAVRLCPDTELALRHLQSLGLQARMTGSGSAVFAAVPTAEAEAAFRSLSWPTGWQTRVCEGLSEHPLLWWQKDAII